MKVYFSLNNNLVQGSVGQTSTWDPGSFHLMALHLHRPQSPFSPSRKRGKAWRITQEVFMDHFSLFINSKSVMWPHFAASRVENDSLGRQSLLRTTLRYGRGLPILSRQLITSISPFHIKLLVLMTLWYFFSSSRHIISIPLIQSLSHLLPCPQPYACNLTHIFQLFYRVWLSKQLCSKSPLECYEKKPQHCMG